MARSANSSDIWGRAVSLALHDLRIQAGLSLKGLEERSGIANTKLSFYENNEVRVWLGTIEKMANGLGITVTEFMAHAETKIAGLRRQQPDPFLKVVTSRKQKRPRA